MSGVHVISKCGRSCSCGGTCGQKGGYAPSLGFLGDLSDWIPGVAIAEGAASWLSSTASDATTNAVTSAANAAGSQVAGGIASGVSSGITGAAKVLGPYLLGTAVVLGAAIAASAIVKGRKR